ncbi:hypothetical protein NHQ30_009283 [Ciborinia camelliae]|nr:hypothetical protein NHQ30_009283 [Ciborinia camelliae]
MPAKRHSRRLIADGVSPYPKPKPPERFSRFLGDETIEFRVGHSHSLIKVHKNVLCEKLEVFDAMLRGNFSEATAKVIDLPEDRFQAFELLVQWCYTNRIPMPDETTSHAEASVRVELYCLAHKYCALELQDFATNYIITFLKINEDRPRAMDAKWLTRIVAEIPRTQGYPGPIRYFYGFLHRLALLASKADASELAVTRFNNFMAEDPSLSDFTTQKFHPNLDTDESRALLNKSAEQIAERLNPSSTTLCEYHTHQSMKILECPVFQEIKGSAKYSPDAFVIVAELKRGDNLEKSLLKHGVPPYQASFLPDGVFSLTSYTFRNEINANVKPFTKQQRYNGTKELRLMGIISNYEGRQGIYKFEDGMSIEKL